MPRYPVKLAEDKYVYWSTVVDAPICGVCTKDEMARFLNQKEASQCWLDHSLQEVADESRIVLVDNMDWNGVFWYTEDTAGNRAGPNESTLTTEEIIEVYTCQ